MRKYKILYNYNTGDSETTEENLKGWLELDFDNLDVAKQNLKRIEEHYTQYTTSSDNFDKKQDLFKKNQDKDWFVKKLKDCIYFTRGGIRQMVAMDIKDSKKYLDAYNADKKISNIEIGTFIDDFYAKQCIILYTDNNKPFQMSAPWCGYFESLNSVEIEEDKSDRKISFR